MKIGILQTGQSPDELRSDHGDYDTFFVDLLSGRGFEFETYKVLYGELPDDANMADGWIVTGSKFSVLEDHTWIKPLERFLQNAFHLDVPIVGICFGHQVLAQALGGKVEKHQDGWAVGPKAYQTSSGKKLRQLAWHQDQVTQVPASATVLAGNDFCQNAYLAYGDKAFTMQPHPEFTPAFMQDLVAARRSVLPTDIADSAMNSLGDPRPLDNFAHQLETFLKTRVSQI